MSSELQQTTCETRNQECEVKKPSRLLFVDILRVLSIFAVLVGHASAYDVSKVVNINSASWWSANIADSCIRWCIPVFFMITGILLLNPAKEESYWVFIKKRFLRIGIPFVVWSIFYSYAKHYFLDPDYSTIDSMWKTNIKELLSGNVYYHFWFVYTLLGVYLIAPIFRATIKKFSRNEVLIYIWLWVLIAFGIPTIQYVYGICSGEALEIKLLNTPYLTGYIGYAVLGYYLGSKEINKTLRSLFYFGGLVGIILIPILMYTTNRNVEVLDETFYSYFTLPILLVSISFFLFIKQVDWENKLSGKMKKIVFSLSNASFGIYLVHMFIEDAWIDKMSIWSNTPVFIKVMGVTLITFTLSFIFVKIVSLNKNLSKILFG